jgi:hypothetical protein
MEINELDKMSREELINYVKSLENDIRILERLRGKNENP